MNNRLLALLGSAGCPGVILGVVIGKDATKPICKVKFAEEGDFNACVEWVKKHFCATSGRKELIVTVARNDGNREVEIKG